MNVAQFLRSLLGRPVICTLIAILAIIAGVAGWMSTSRVYESTAVAVILPPGSGNPDAMLNPLINMNPNLAQLAAVIATALRTEGGQEASVAAGGTGEFTVDTTFGDSPQFAQLTSQLVITTKGNDAESARRSAQALVDFAQARLDKVQADAWVPARNNAIMVTSVQPTAGTELPTSALRRAGAYAVSTALGGLIVLMLYEAALERMGRGERRRKRNHRSRTSNRRSSTVSDDDAAIEIHDSGANNAGRRSRIDGDDAPTQLLSAITFDSSIDRPAR